MKEPGPQGQGLKRATAEAQSSSLAIERSKSEGFESKVMIPGNWMKVIITVAWRGEGATASHREREHIRTECVPFTVFIPFCLLHAGLFLGFIFLFEPSLFPAFTKKSENSFFHITAPGLSIRGLSIGIKMHCNTGIGFPWRSICLVEFNK